jgi:hypothetical protein
MLQHQRRTSNDPAGHSLILLISLDNRVGVDVRDIGSDTGSTSDIVKRKTSDEGVGLEEEGHGLTDTTFVMSAFVS